MNKSSRKIFIIIIWLFIPCLGFSSNSSATFKPNNLPQPISPQVTEPHLNHLLDSNQADLADFNQPKQSTQTTAVDEQTLLANPNLLKRAMVSVVLAKNTDQIAIILPIYNQLSDKDSLLITYANALVFHGKNQYQQAISLYRNVISQNPNFTAARFDLAIALYKDKQFTSARHQLQKLKSEKFSEQDLNFINQLIQHIEKNNNWSFSSNFYYRHENNINSVPKQSQITLGNGTLTFDKPEKARGFHLSLGAYKKFNLKSNWFSSLSLSSSINHFLNTNDYNDYIFQVGIGLGYQTANYSAEIKPFFSRRIYGDDAYSKTFGLGLNSHYKINNQWQIANYTEWSDESYDGSKHLTGERYRTNFSLSYAHSAKQLWTLGVNYNKNNAKYLDDEFHLRGVSIGWQQEWTHGISTHLNLSASKKDHYGSSDLSFNIQRNEKHYGSSLSFWHRDFHFLGITPKFNWQWKRINSNHFYHDKVSNQFFINFSKTF